MRNPKIKRFTVVEPGERQRLEGQEILYLLQAGGEKRKAAEVWKWKSGKATEKRKCGRADYLGTDRFKHEI